MRHRFSGRLLCIVALLSCTSCSNSIHSSQQVVTEYREIIPGHLPSAPVILPGNTAYSTETVAHGKYLVELLGCGSCHTQGALLGQPDPRFNLAGSTVGIAYTNPADNNPPGVVYAGNLTPDTETGIGRWSEQDIAHLLTSGEDRLGHYKLPVMPWMAYSRLSADDALAIAAYLKSLSPVSHRIPARIYPGQKTATPYVHIGLYQKQ